MGHGRGNYTFGQRMTVFAVTFVGGLLGLGIPLLVVWLAGLAYFTVSSIFAGILLAALVLFDIFFMYRELNKKMHIEMAVTGYVALFYICFVVFTNLIASNVMNMTWFFNWFK